MNKIWETTFIFSPKLSLLQIETLISDCKKILNNLGSQIVEEEHWGIRKLAYSIDNNDNGYYYRIKHKAPTLNIGAFESQIKQENRILRHLTTIFEENIDKSSLKKNSNSLRLFFKLDDYSPLEIGEIVAYLSEVYHSIGGDYLEIKGASSHILSTNLEYA